LQLISENSIEAAQSDNDGYETPTKFGLEFPRSQLKLGRTLGEGAFGKVLMADAYALLKAECSTAVAVKMLKEGHSDEDVKDLISELELMKQVGTHDNIINLLGCCSEDGPLYVIVEYVPHGNLRDFLRNHRPGPFSDSLENSNDKQVVTDDNLLSIAYQIACGMEYLASRKCIHRDLAARNILVGDNLSMKIADFGLARNIHSRNYYRKVTIGQLPIKWMAPESLCDDVYDSQSDV